MTPLKSLFRSSEIEKSCSGATSLMTRSRLELDNHPSAAQPQLGLSYGLFDPGTTLFKAPQRARRAQSQEESGANGGLCWPICR